MTLTEGEFMVQQEIHPASILQHTHPEYAMTTQAFHPFQSTDPSSSAMPMDHLGVGVSNMDIAIGSLPLQYGNVSLALNNQGQFGMQPGIAMPHGFVQASGAGVRMSVGAQKESFEDLKAKLATIVNYGGPAPFHIPLQGSLSGGQGMLETVSTGETPNLTPRPLGGDGDQILPLGTTPQNGGAPSTSLQNSLNPMHPITYITSSGEAATYYPIVGAAPTFMSSAASSVEDSDPQRKLSRFQVTKVVELPTSKDTSTSVTPATATPNSITPLNVTPVSSPVRRGRFAITKIEVKSDSNTGASEVGSTTSTDETLIAEVSSLGGRESEAISSSRESFATPFLQGASQTGIYSSVDSSSMPPSMTSSLVSEDLNLVTTPQSKCGVEGSTPKAAQLTLSRDGSQDDGRENVQTLQEDSDISEDDESYRLLIQRQEEELAELRRRHQQEQDRLRTRRIRKHEQLSPRTPPTHPSLSTNKRPQSLNLGQAPLSPQPLKSCQEPLGLQGEDKMSYNSNAEPFFIKRERMISEDLIETSQGMSPPRFQLRAFPENIPSGYNQLTMPPKQSYSNAGAPIPNFPYGTAVPSASLVLTSSGYATIPVMQGYNVGAFYQDECSGHFTTGSHTLPPSGETHPSLTYPSSRSPSNISTHQQHQQPHPSTPREEVNTWAKWE